MADRRYKHCQFHRRQARERARKRLNKWIDDESTWTIHLAILILILITMGLIARLIFFIFTLYL